MSSHTVMQAFTAWFHNEGTRHIKQKYGEDAELSLVILDRGRQHDWQKPLAHAAAWSTDQAKGDGDGGFVMNVEHKLHFTLRTGLNSVEARYNKHLILPGDFPYEGAGFHRGFCGGVSGLKEESDWWVFRFCVDKLIELLEQDIQPVLDAGAKPDRTVADKYLLAGALANSPGLRISEDAEGKILMGAPTDGPPIGHGLMLTKREGGGWHNVPRHDRDLAAEDRIAEVTSNTFDCPAVDVLTQQYLNPDRTERPDGRTPGYMDNIMPGNDFAPGAVGFVYQPLQEQMGLTQPIDTRPEGLGNLGEFPGQIS